MINIGPVLALRGVADDLRSRNLFYQTFSTVCNLFASLCAVSFYDKSALCSVC